PEDRARCLAAGMDGHLGKPIDPRELRAVLGGDQPGQAAADADSAARAPSPDALDYQRVLDGADAMVVRIIAQPFRGNWPGQLRALREAAQAADAAALQRGAHALRGVLGNFGATPAVTLTRRIELLGAQGQTDPIRPLLPELETALRALDQALQTWLERAPA
ncbi:response regulator, partial [Leptospira sp. 96542]|nr:response regulator [Leptospira sp. 96542]